MTATPVVDVETVVAEGHPRWCGDCAYPLGLVRITPYAEGRRYRCFACAPVAIKSAVVLASAKPDGRVLVEFLRYPQPCEHEKGPA